ncbi:MAG: hypothetical protein N0C84_00375 [Candidatus Thiodiazotropha taylori]|uniref:Chitinase n=1 Tax=Candidatus Thiodiazotropha taylori TaxID=2792791 RepID=A0A9E4K9U7_9GAMM|nr:hypothetical protein [Candidatus Thiodiazotropha taylori]MCW4254899.1 hypothetical protein [Candidatus Thiodiazotropha taylori]
MKKLLMTTALASVFITGTAVAQEETIEMVQVVEHVKAITGQPTVEQTKDEGDWQLSDDQTDVPEGKLREYREVTTYDNSKYDQVTNTYTVYCEMNDGTEVSKEYSDICLDKENLPQVPVDEITREVNVLAGDGVLSIETRLVDDPDYVDPNAPETIPVKMTDAGWGGVIRLNSLGTLEEVQTFVDAMNEQHGASSAWGVLTTRIDEHWENGAVVGYVVAYYEKDRFYSAAAATEGYDVDLSDVDYETVTLEAHGSGTDTGGETGGNKPPVVIDPDTLSETEQDVGGGRLIDMSKPIVDEYWGVTYYEAYYAEGHESAPFDGLTTVEAAKRDAYGPGNLIGYIAVDGSADRSGHYREKTMAFSKKTFHNGELEGQTVVYKLPDDDIMKNMQIAGAPANYTALQVNFLPTEPTYQAKEGVFTPPKTGMDFGHYAGKGEFPAQFEMMSFREAVRIAEKRGQRVMASIGGAIQSLNWIPLAAEGNSGEIGPLTQSLIDFVVDSGVSGLDVDYEKHKLYGVDPNQAIDEFIGASLAVKRALEEADRISPKSNGEPRVMTMAGWSTGADCSANTVAAGIPSSACSKWSPEVSGAPAVGGSTPATPPLGNVKLPTGYADQAYVQEVLAALQAHWDQNGGWTASYDNLISIYLAPYANKVKDGVWTVKPESEQPTPKGDNETPVETPVAQKNYQLSLWGGGAGLHRHAFYELEQRGYNIADLFDTVTIMSYDASYVAYDPVVAYQQYRDILPPEIAVAIGFTPVPEGWYQGGQSLVGRNSEANLCYPGTFIEGDQYGNYVFEPYSVERSLSAIDRNTYPRDGGMVWTAQSRAGLNGFVNTDVAVGTRGLVQVAGEILHNGMVDDREHPVFNQGEPDVEPRTNNAEIPSESEWRKNGGGSYTDPTSRSKYKSDAQENLYKLSTCN